MSLFYNNFYTNYPSRSVDSAELLKIDVSTLYGLIKDNSKKIEQDLEAIKKLSKQFKVSK